MNPTTSFLGLSLNFNGIVKFRQSVKAALQAFDRQADVKFSTIAGTSATLTAADHFLNSEGEVMKDVVIYTTNASDVALALAKAQSDLLPIGQRFLLVQSAGAATITGSGGLTVTARGTPTGGRTAIGVKVSATLILVDYPTLAS